MELAGRDHRCKPHDQPVQRLGPSGDSGPQPNAGTVSVDGNGTVTIDTLPGYKGFLSADKKTIVGVFTETSGPSTWYHLMITQITGQTYAASDLVGTSRGHMLGVGNTNFWSHYTTTGAAGGGITFSSWLDSSGGTTAPSAVTASITSAGTVTLSNPSFQFHGTMSDDKKFTVITQTNGAGVYSLSVRRSRETGPGGPRLFGGGVSRREKTALLRSGAQRNTRAPELRRAILRSSKIKVLWLRFSSERKMAEA